VNTPADDLFRSNLLACAPRANRLNLVLAANQWELQTVERTSAYLQRKGFTP